MGTKCEDIIDNKYTELLTICIPTYNRYQVLLEGVIDLIAKVKKYNIPIIVVDNCSTDDTAKIAELKKDYKYLSYFCQESNKGYDINFETSLKLSKAKYTWVISDANRLNINNIAKLLNDLETYLPLAYIVNSKNRVKNKAKEYNNVNDLISNLGWHMTMLSATIFSKEIIDNANFPKYRGTNFLHFGVLFEYFANAQDFRVMWSGLEMIRTSKLSKSNSWNPYRVAEIFGKDWTEIVLSLPKTIDNAAKIECIKKHGKLSKIFSLKHLCKQRAVNGLNDKIFTEVKPFIKYFAPNKEFLILLISKMPNAINFYYWKYKIQNKLKP